MAFLAAYLSRLSLREQRHIDEDDGEEYLMGHGTSQAALVEGEQREKRLVQHQHCGRKHELSAGGPRSGL